MPLNTAEGSLACLDINQAPWPVKAKKAQARSPPNNGKYKTQMCKNYAIRGHCPYRKKCQFAHGTEQLNQGTHNSLFKTKKCKHFWDDGHCPYGARCQFNHSLPVDRSTQSYLHIVEMAITGASGSDHSRVLSFLSS